MTEQTRTTAASALPASIGQLQDLAYNLRWRWDAPTRNLFARLDPLLWENSNQNPALLLQTVDPARLQEVAADAEYSADVANAVAELDVYMASDATWFRQAHGDAGGSLIAYFSAEFGLTEALPIYSGGLGVLAGDHLKSASDLGIPLVAVGLLYQQGYFRQQLSETGWQQELYDTNDFEKLPLVPQRGPDGAPVVVEVPFPDRPVLAQVWRVQVGRVPLYLLDTNFSDNRPEDRDITDQLYGGDVETRIRQELVLGIGGYRALEQLGIQPTVCHMNEGHSAFLSLERVRTVMQQRGIAFAEAQTIVQAGSVFTTHTPVAAGHDYFPPELMDRYLGPFIQELDIARKDFLALGRHDPNNEGEYFCQTIFALRMSQYANGVSKLHGEVSRDMWKDLYPDTAVNDVPVGHVTNGVHLLSYVSPQIDALCDQYLGANWRHGRSVSQLREEFDRVPSDELWQVHTKHRWDLVRVVHHRLRTQLERDHSQEESSAGADVLNPDALTIGFARRFATYKRATLLLRDPDRLARILTSPVRPTQVVFAGKAHPRDEGGKELIRRVVELSRQEPFRGRLVFLEDYNIGVARTLVQGVDVWLNNPQRPFEASGTSGMKAAANGVLNVSTLDGWWDEAWAATRDDAAPPGWAIGDGSTYDDQEKVEADALYNLLEREVIPLYYDRDGDGLPRRWIERMKSAMYTISPVYNTDRMLCEYAERYYLPAIDSYGQAR
ncbi:MAG: alpha-glucan family phosphorylase [Chloroflexia bacterium]|nr:alpha-glucan family phosphorylase [Chloroflexia bacterium]